MPAMFTKIHVEDYEAWKPIFDSGRSTIRAAAKGHRLYRSVEDPNDVFVAVDFDSVEDARAARERLLASGMLERVDAKVAPTIVEEAEALAY